MYFMLIDWKSSLVFEVRAGMIYISLFNGVCFKHSWVSAEFEELDFCEFQELLTSS